ncbi:PRTRC system protein C [Vreelandella rituensis]|uniref:PRTRC system protein C n=1 Tax=Vreelandella rituensis TaxID=2282306 RepID=A0A368UBT6_9GAMM|nr:PRTRC system protein C [Halomonas rituensis]RCV93892.1 PRTRC system protein C [Halomonas rituensis]
MSATLIQVIRVFRFKSRDLPDPNPTMTQAEVLEHYTNQYPELLGGKVVPPTQEGDALVYELRANFGDKG